MFGNEFHLFQYAKKSLEYSQTNVLPRIFCHHLKGQRMTARDCISKPMYHHLSPLWFRCLAGKYSEKGEKNPEPRSVWHITRFSDRRNYVLLRHTRPARVLYKNEKNPTRCPTADRNAFMLLLLVVEFEKREKLDTRKVWS